MGTVESEYHLQRRGRQLPYSLPVRGQLRKKLIMTDDQLSECSRCTCTTATATATTNTFINITTITTTATTAAVDRHQSITIKSTSDAVQQPSHHTTSTTSVTLQPRRSRLNKSSRSATGRCRVRKENALRECTKQFNSRPLTAGRYFRAVPSLFLLILSTAFLAASLSPVNCLPSSRQNVVIKSYNQQEIVVARGGGGGGGEENSVNKVDSDQRTHRLTVGKNDNYIDDGNEEEGEVNSLSSNGGSNKVNADSVAFGAPTAPSGTTASSTSASSAKPPTTTTTTTVKPTTANTTDDADKHVCRTDKCIDASRYLLNSLDLDASPCDDFYKFACGSYLKDHPIPLRVKSWSHFVKVFYEIRDKIKEKLNKNKKEFQADTNNSMVFSKLHDFFHGCLDKDQRNTTGYGSLFSLIKDMGGWPMVERNWSEASFHWEKAYVQMTKLDMFYILRIEAVTDLKNPNRTLIKIGPPYKIKENIVEFGGYNKVPFMSDKYKYTFVGRRSQAKAEEVQADSDGIAPTQSPKKIKLDPNLEKKYLAIIKELKDHSGFPASNTDQAYWVEQLEAISTLQAQLEDSAQPIVPMEEYQDGYEKYLFNFTHLKEILHGGGFNLTLVIEDMFTKEIAMRNDQEFFVPDIEYLKKAAGFMAKTKRAVIANYLITNMVMAAASHTTPKMVSLLVTESMTDPEVMGNICYEETSRYLPELMGKFYLDKVAKLTGDWRQELDSIIAALRDAFKTTLTKSEWMDKDTIAMALKKLEHMSMHIGSPDWYSVNAEFEKYSHEFNKINPKNYFSSVIEVTRVGQNLENRDLTERLHSSSAQLTSWPGHRKIIDVNAFYYFTTNGVYIPAAILQSPFFYQDGVPKAVTFGSMGMILGHEMTHSMDNSGRLYDFEGALKKWWSDKTLASFHQKTKCFVDQYSGYQEQSIHIDGNATLEENIADNGGVRQSYSAFQKFKLENPEAGMQRLPVDLANFTPDQLFFISFATMWCARLDPSEINVQNVHSPPSIRVLGSLANFDEFTKAFNCKKDSKMNRANKCVLW